jgi:hypothetical protein
MALAESLGYRNAADARSTLRAYAGDLAHHRASWEKHGFIPVPAPPAIAGAYLAAAGEGYAMPTLRRRVAAIAPVCGVAGQPLDTKHPAIRETVRGIGGWPLWAAVIDAGREQCVALQCCGLPVTV